MPSFPNVKVVGMHFRGGDAKEIAAGLLPGETLRLEREPDNAFDANAIKVFFESLWIGFIEGPQAAWIAPHMDEGTEFTATVTGHEEVTNLKGKVNSYPLVLIEEK